MVIGTTKTGEKIDLGKLTIVTEKEPTSYPGGGPTVPGSSTGIGSTMGKGGGRLSPSQYGTGGYATSSNSSGPTAAEIKAAKERVLAEEKARQEAFSRTGGIVGVGQVSPYFKTGVQDIKTDSQAIKTATQVADQVSQEAKTKVTRTYGMKINRTFGTKDIEVLETKDKTYYGIGENTYLDEATFKQYAEKGSYPISSKTFTKQDIQSGKVDTVAQTKRIADIKSEESQFEFLAGFVAGGGKEIATIASGVTGKVVGAVTAPIAKTIAPVSQPVVQGVSQTIGSAADDIYNLLSPGAKQVVSGVAKKQVVQKGIEVGGVLVKTEVAGEALRQAGLYTPEIVSEAYLVATPGRVFTPTEETKKVAEKVYTSTRVSYYGGERQTIDETGKVIKTEKVPGKASMGEGFVEGMVPGIKVATGFAPEFETQVKENIKDIPEYKALKTEQEKIQYEKEFKDYYLNIGQIGGTLGQVLVETGGEVTGGGRLYALSPSGIKTRAGAILRFGLASGSTGVQEGIYSAELASKVEQRKLTDQERLNAAILGGGVAGTFGALQAGTMGTKYNSLVNIAGEAMDFPGEPLGDVLGGQVKNVTGVPDIKIAGGLVATSYGPDITTSTKTKVKTSTKTKQKEGIGIKEITDFFLSDQTKTQQEIINKSLGISSKTSVSVPSGIVNVPGTDVVPTDTKPKDITDITTDITDETKDDETTDEEAQKEEQKEEVSTNVPSWANVPSSVPVIAPQRFLMPGFLPIGLGSAEGTRERTKIYDELSAAGKRFQQLSGLPFVQQESVKRRKTVMINGKEFKIGARVKK